MSSELLIISFGFCSLKFWAIRDICSQARCHFIWNINIHGSAVALESITVQYLIVNVGSVLFAKTLLVTFQEFTGCVK